MILSEGPVIFGPHGTWVWSAPIDYGSVVFHGAGLFPNAGTFYHDASARKNNGTLVGGPTWQYDSVRGWGNQLVGTSSQYIDTNTTFPEAGDLFADAGRQWTVSMWSRVGAGVEGMIIGRGTTNTSLQTFAIYMHNAHGQPAIQLRETITASGLSQRDDNWHLNTVTWDGTTARYYSDGTYIKDLGVGARANDTQRMIIGARANGTGLYLTGNVSMPLITNTALSPPQIAWLANRANNPWQPWRRKSWAVTGIPPVGNRRRRLLLACGA